MDQEQAKIDAKGAADKRKAELSEMASLVGRQFTDGIKNAKVIGFETDKGIGHRRGPAYLINLGNPHRFDYVLCDDFKQQFNSEVKE